MTWTRFLLFSFLLFLVGLPLAAEPRWSAELPLSAPRLVPQSGGDQAVASSGDDYLVVWSAADDIFAARVSSDHELIDRIPMLLTERGPYDQKPEVVWDGERYLVAWVHEWGTLRGRYVERDGDLSAPFDLLTGTYASSATLASNGDTVLVVVRGMASAFLLRRDRSMIPIDRMVMGNFSHAAAATDGDGYVLALVWTSPTRIGIVRVSASGAVTHTTSFGGLWGPSIAWTGKDYLLVATGDARTTAIRLDRLGNRVGDSEHSFAEQAPFSAIASAGDGTATVISHPYGPSGGFEYFIARRVVEGRFEDARPVGIYGYGPKIAGSLLVWQGTESVMHASIDARSGSVGKPEHTSLSAPVQQVPASVATPAGWFTVWQQRDGGWSKPPHIRGAVVGPSLGRSEDFVVAAGAESHTAPAVAASADVVLVVWTTGDQVPSVLGRRFTASGVALDPQPFLIAEASSGGGGYDYATPTPPAVVWNGRYFIVAYSRFRGDSEQRLFVSRVTSEGLVLDPDGKPMPPSARQTLQSHPAMATTGGMTLLVWQDGYPMFDCRISPCWFPPAGEIQAILVGVEGDPLATQPMNITSSNIIALNPAVAVSSAGDFLVAWSGSHGVQAQRIGRFGAFEGETINVAATPTDPNVAVEARGRDFFVAWQPSGVTESYRLQPREVRGRWVGTDNVLGPVTVFAAESTGRPSLRARGTDLLLLYSRWSAGDGGVDRVYLQGFIESAQRPRTVRRGR